MAQGLTPDELRIAEETVQQNNKAARDAALAGKPDPAYDAHQAQVSERTSNQRMEAERRALEACTGIKEKVGFQFASSEREIAKIEHGIQTCVAKKTGRTPE